MQTIPTGRTITYSDAEHAPALKVDDNIELRFKDQVIAGTGDIILSNGSDIRRIPINDANQITFSSSKLSGNSVIINPTQDLVPNTHYSIQMASGVIQGMAGHVNARIDDPGALSFNTTDSAPLLMFSDIGTPAWEPDSLAELPADNGIQLYFDEAVTAGSGNIVISNNSDTRVIDIHDTNQVIFNSESPYLVVINSAADLIPNTSYHIQIASGVITDSAGNAYAGINDPDALSFTATSSSPSLWWSNPWGESTLKTDDDIYFYFNEAVTAGNGYIVISNGSDTRTIDIHDTSQVTFDGFNNVIINPATDLVPGTSYSIMMAAGVIADNDGHAYAGISDPAAFNFTTASSDPMLYGISINTFSTIGPQETITVKTDDGIALQFDEQVTPGNGDIIISNGADTRIIDIHDTSQVTFGDYADVFIKPIQDWILDTPYTVRIAAGVVTDTGGNAFAGTSAQSEFSFTPVASNPSLVWTNLTSIDNQSFLSAASLWSEQLTLQADTGIQLHFDEMMAAGSGNIILSNGTDTRVIDIHDASQVTFDDYGDVLVRPAGNLLPGATYRIEIADGTITDTAGNPYAGINGANTLEFTATDPYFITMTGVDSSGIAAS